MTERFANAVYDTLRGIRLPEARVEGVENLFEPGGKCDSCYAKMLDAYECLRERLGGTVEDADVEVIISSLLEIEYEVSLRMYMYGAKFGEK